MRPQEEGEDKDADISDKQTVMQCGCSKMKDDKKENFEFAT